MNTICCQNISFRYQEEIILDNISVSIDPGTFTIIVGPNGAGKTTFLKLLTGLLEPDKGQIILAGQSVREAQIKGLIHLVPQIYNKNAAQFPATVEEIVGLGLHVNSKVTKEEYTRRVTESLELVGMQIMGKRRIGDLSGGQQQRVMIAQALAREPQFLLLDEPTSGIDFAASDQILHLLNRLAREKGMTILMVTHDVVEAGKLADRVLCINRGLCYDGDSEGFLTSHRESPLTWHFGG